MGLDGGDVGEDERNLLKSPAVSLASLGKTSRWNTLLDDTRLTVAMTTPKM